MSDFNSQLPIRTETAGDVIVKVADATLPSQQLAVNSDGSVNITDNGGSLTVDATNLDIRDLSHTQDSIEARQTTHDNLNVNANIQVGDADVSNGNPVPISDAGGSITVDGSVTVSATDLDIRNLSATQDNVAISDGTDTLAVNADGSINVAFAPGAEIKITDGTDDLAINADGSLNAVVTATDLDIRNLVFATDKVDVTGSDVTVSNTVTVQSTNLDIRDLVFATDKVDVSGSTVALDAPTLAALESITVQNGAGVAAVNIQDGGNSITVDATDLDIRDLTHVSDSIRVGDGTDFLAVNSDGSINVRLSDRSGVEQLDYNTASAVAAGGTSNHDYTTTGAFRLTQVEAAASGKMRIEVQIETGAATNVFNTIAVQFNSTANPNMSLSLSSPPLVVSGARVRVIRRNADNQSQDLYSTIVGYNE